MFILHVDATQKQFPLVWIWLFFFSIQLCLYWSRLKAGYRSMNMQLVRTVSGRIWITVVLKCIWKVRYHSENRRKITKYWGIFSTLKWICFWNLSKSKINATSAKDRSMISAIWEIESERMIYNNYDLRRK